VLKVIQKNQALLLFAAGVVLFSTNIWGMELYILDEARNAGCAREMLERGDLIVPTFNYDLRVDKPPLHYYFMILAYSLLGFSEFSARLFSSVAGACTVLATFLFARHHLGERAGLWAAICLLVSIHFSLEFHLAVPDPYLILFLVSSVFLLFHGCQTNRDLFIYLGYVSVGLATLAKGPIAIFLPGAIFLLFLLLNGEFSWPSLMRFKILQGILVVLLVLLPWYTAVWIQTDGEWVKRFLFEQNLSRLVETKEGHGGSFLLPAIIVILGLFPFSLYLPQALALAWRERGNRFLQLCSISLLVIVGFFSLAQTKLPNYPMPCFPFLAIILGTFISKIQSRISLIWINYIGYIFISLGIPLGIYYGLQNISYLEASRNIAFGFLLLPLGGLTGLIFVLKDRVRWAHYCVVGSLVLTNFYLFYFGYPAVFDRNPVATSLAKMESGIPVVYYKRVNQAFIFHLQQQVLGADSPQELNGLLEGYPRAYVLSHKEFWEEISQMKGLSIINEGTDTFESRITVLIEYRREVKK